MHGPSTSLLHLLPERPSSLAAAERSLNLNILCRLGERGGRLFNLMELGMQRVNKGVMPSSHLAVHQWWLRLATEQADENVFGSPLLSIADLWSVSTYMFRVED
jgi:hypothetical protein